MGVLKDMKYQDCAAQKSKTTEAFDQNQVQVCVKSVQSAVFILKVCFVYLLVLNKLDDAVHGGSDTGTVQWTSVCLGPNV